MTLIPSTRGRRGRKDGPHPAFSQSFEFKFSPYTLCIADPVKICGGYGSLHGRLNLPAKLSPNRGINNK
jgi:hypothetical protein